MYIQGDFSVTILFLEMDYYIFFFLMFFPTLLVFLYAILKRNEKQNFLCKVEVRYEADNF